MTEFRHGAPEEAGLDPRRIDLARERCAGWVEQGHTPSLVVLAARNGVIALHEAFGQRSPAGDPLRPDTLYPVLSVSKSLTAAMVLTLVEDGLLGLHRPVQSYLPELSGEGTEGVLVAHLLTHTSGFSDLALDARSMAARAVGRSASTPAAGDAQSGLTYLTDRWSAPLTYKPAERMEYCNHGYELLGEIVRRVAASSLDDYARARLFDPLGMKDTCYRLPDALRPRVVERSLDAPGARPAPPWFAGIETDAFRHGPSAAGGAYSTAFDLAIFLETLLGGGAYAGVRVLSRPSVEAMTRNQNPGIGTEYPLGQWKRESGYGYGWLIENPEKWPWAHGSLLTPGTFHHQGAFGALAWADPATGVLGVWLGVTLDVSSYFEQFWNADLYQNLISAAVLP